MCSSWWHSGTSSSSPSSSSPYYFFSFFLLLASQWPGWHLFHHSFATQFFIHSFVSLLLHVCKRIVSSLCLSDNCRPAQRRDRQAIHNIISMLVVTLCLAITSSSSSFSYSFHNKHTHTHKCSMLRRSDCYVSTTTDNRQRQLLSIRLYSQFNKINAKRKWKELDRQFSFFSRHGFFVEFCLAPLWLGCAWAERIQLIEDALAMQNEMKVEQKQTKWFHINVMSSASAIVSSYPTLVINNGKGSAIHDRTVFSQMFSCEKLIFDQIRSGNASNYSASRRLQGFYDIHSCIDVTSTLYGTRTPYVQQNHQ